MPIMDALRVPPLRGQLEHRARRRRAPEHDDDRARRLRQARRAARRGVRRHAQRARRCRSSTTSSASRRRSRRRRRRSTPAPSRRRRSPSPRRRRRAYYRQAMQLAFCQPNVRGLFLFHAFDEPALAGVAVRPLLRRRHAEDEPRRPCAARDRRSRGAASSRTAPGLRLAGRRRRSRSSGAARHAHLRPRLLVRRAALPPAREAARARSAAARSAARRRRCRSRVAEGARPPYRLRRVGDRRRQPGAARRCCRQRPARLAFDAVEGPVRRLHLLPRRPGVAAAAGRGARRRRRTRSPRWSRTAPTRFDAPARVHDDGRPAGDRLLPLEDHRALRGPRRARRRAERRRRSPAGSRRRTRTSRRRRRRSTRARARARKIVPQGSPYLVVYPFVKVRPWYALPRSDRQRAMDEHIRIGREEFPGDPQPHDVLVRDRRPGVHDRVRVRRAGRLHAPDAAPARLGGVGATPSATRRSSSGSTCRSARRSTASTASSSRVEL